MRPWVGRQNKPGQAETVRRGTGTDAGCPSLVRVHFDGNVRNVSWLRFENCVKLRVVDLSVPSWMVCTALLYVDFCLLWELSGLTLVRRKSVSSGTLTIRNERETDTSLWQTCVTLVTTLFIFCIFALQTRRGVIHGGSDQSRVTHTVKQERHHKRNVTQTNDRFVQRRCQFLNCQFL